MSKTRPILTNQEILSKAESLLISVLQNNEEEVLKIAESNPDLFFIKSSAYDNATDLAGNHRLIKDWSPYQALFGTGDAVMFASVTPYLDAYLANLPDGSGAVLAFQQEQEKFPHGFAFPPSHFDFDSLVEAITNDQKITDNLWKPDASTTAALEKFKEYFKPGEVKVGHHFNMNDIIKAYEIYDDQWNKWSKEKSMFFSLFVIGFLQRLFTTCFMQAAYYGLSKQKLETKSINENKHNNILLTLTSLEGRNDGGRLGWSFLINCYYGGKLHVDAKAELIPQESGFFVQEFCEARISALSKLRIGLLNKFPEKIANHIVEFTCGDISNPETLQGIRDMVTLSKTCKNFHAFFQPEINKRRDKAAQNLLVAVLYGNEVEVLKIAMTTPGLFFVKSSAYDYAMDLAGKRRLIQDWSPYQALFGTSDVVMLAKVKPYLDAYLNKLPDGHGPSLALQQEQEKFPHGFDFPPSVYDFNPLADAIARDPGLCVYGKQADPNTDTLAALEKFRADFQPGVIMTGHHFNMNDLLKAYQVPGYRTGVWNLHQNQIFNVYVIGFLQRLMSAYFIQYIAYHGLQNQTPLERGVTIKNSNALDGNFIVRISKCIPILPLDSDPEDRLGLHCFIDRDLPGGQPRLHRLRAAAWFLADGRELGFWGNQRLGPPKETPLEELCRTSISTLSELAYSSKQVSSICAIS